MVIRLRCCCCFVVCRRNVIYKRSGRWAIKEKNGKKFPKGPAKKAAPAAAAPKPGYFYSTEDTPTPMKSSKGKKKPTKIKAGCKAGAVLILLAGVHRGKRVICLGSLPSGLLLVTGPFELNGCPVRRVNQCYVIATSTTVDVSKVDTSKFTDAYFSATRQTLAAKNASKEAKGAKDFMEEDAPAKEVSAERKADQAAVDGAIKISDPDLKLYLSKKFFLTKGQYPHTMKF